MSLSGIVVSVGGSPEPLIKTLNEHKPKYVLYVISMDTRDKVEQHIRPHLSYTPDWQSLVEVSDPQYLENCYKQILERIDQWLGDYHLHPANVGIDYTGGTKVMSVALALAAAEKNIALFSYVGGTERDRENRGVVRDGFEHIIPTRNPLQAGATREIERANWLLDNYYAAAAGEVLQKAQEICDQKHKARLKALTALSQALDKADRFQFSNACKAFQPYRKELKYILNDSAFCSLVSLCETWKAISDDLQCQQKTPGEKVLLELFANADRRAKQARYDDATGRLYRGIELKGQQLVKEAFGAELGKIKLDAFPPKQRDRVEREFGPPSDQNEYLLGVKNLYSCLKFKEDAKYHKYKDLIDSLSHHLTVRNHSILAHGLDPVSENGFTGFRKAALTALGVTDADIPRWPEIVLTIP